MIKHFLYMRASYVLPFLVFFGIESHAASTLGDVRACFESIVDTTTASGVSAAVAVDNQVVFRKGFGTVEPGATKKVNPATRFRAGSTNKAMTAAAVMSLVDDGRIALNDRAVDIFPQLDVDAEPGWLSRVTIKSLLTHQAAFREFVFIDGPREDADLAASWSDPDFQAIYPLMVRPNTFWNYSNANFALAGLMAEIEDGRYYRRLMKNRVFKPLGMKRTVFTPDEVLQDNNFAAGVSGGSVLGADAYDNAVLRPAGWVWSTADDLLKFARFIEGGKRSVMTKKSWKAMTSKKVNTKELLDLQHYGYGVYIYDYFSSSEGFFDGVKAVQHGGNVPGYTAYFIALPQQNFAMAAMGNTDNLNFDPCIDLAVHATVDARLPNPVATPDLEIDPAKFHDYTGNYFERVGNFGGEFSMAVDALGQLTINFPALDELGVPYDPVLIPISRDNFLLSVQGSFISATGMRNKRTGRITHLRSRALVGEKLN